MKNLSPEPSSSCCPGEAETPILNPALSRRSFLRFASAASAVAAIPGISIVTESHLAAQSRRMPKVHMAGGVYIDANENPMGPAPSACIACEDIVKSGGRYQMDLQFDLIKYFAAQQGLKPEYVAVFAGSSEPLHYTVLGFTGPDKSFVTADPGYEAGIMASKISGAKVVKVPLEIRLFARREGDARRGPMRACSTSATRITRPERRPARGHRIPALANKPKGSILLIDEAYIHLSDAQPCIDMVAADKDVVILRTFSKIYGMAGLRCGFAIATARPARQDCELQRMELDAGDLRDCGEGQSDGSESDSGAEEDDCGHPHRDVHLAEREQLRVHSLGEQLFHGEHQAAGQRAFRTRWPPRNVYIGRVWPVMPTWVRVTVGTKSDMTAFQVAFKQVMDAPVVASLAAPEMFEDMPGRFIS